jgi:hypothetical protein
LRPTSGVMPTLAPGGKTGSAANAEENTVELTATIRAIAAEYRSSFMEHLPGLHGAVQWADDAARISGGILEPCGHDGDRSSRPAFSGFDVPATGQGRGPFHRCVPLCQPFCGILPGIRALFEARPAAKYRVPSRRAAGPRAGGMMPLCCARSGTRASGGLGRAALPVS